jgi:elongation factor 1-gamma
MEQHLDGREWLVSVKGETGPSLADLSLGGVLVMAFKLYIDANMRKEFPCVAAWFERLISVDEVKEGFGNPVLVETRVEPKMG